MPRYGPADVVLPGGSLPKYSPHELLAAEAKVGGERHHRRIERSRAKAVAARNKNADPALANNTDADSNLELDRSAKNMDEEPPLLPGSG